MITSTIATENTTIITKIIIGKLRRVYHFQYFHSDTVT